MTNEKWSVKAFLATDQRIPGLGNGTLQDILFRAKINPKCKMASLTEEDKHRLFVSIKHVLAEIRDNGGRDTEKDLFGEAGQYQTILSQKTFKNPCPVCGGEIVKQAYLGGSIYYCIHCQPLE